MRHQPLRLNELLRLRRKLEAESFPRLQMLLIVMISGGTGFVASALLLSGGLLQMWLRYPLAVMAAYGMFLLLLWLWLRTSVLEHVDIPQFPGDGSGSGHSCGKQSEFAGEGGSFGGGGAQGSYADLPSEPSSLVSTENASLLDSTPIGEAVEAAGQAEELAIPLIVLILLGAMLFSSLLIVYSAPTLFAELLLDAALATGLYRKLRRLEPRHWLETAILRTRAIFFMTLLLMMVTGWGMHAYAPKAHSLGEVMGQKAAYTKDK